MNRRAFKFAIPAVIGLAAILLLWASLYDPFSPGADRLLLLLPDGASFSDPRVTVWLDAAAEEGLHLVPMHDSQFLRPLFGKPRCAGIILPDSIHVRAGDLLVTTLHDYVSSGGKLMLVFDAGTKSLQGFYAGERSQFSDLAGVDYALYATLRDKMFESGDVSGTIPAMQSLGVPPGKFFPLSAPSTLPPTQAAPLEVRLRRYKFGDLEYPSFVTQGSFPGELLLHSSAGVVAGVRTFGKGSVLFVNLPLGYLAGDTDGLLLHSFLDYFAEKILALPHLLSVPDGIGGLVLDWHVDSNAAIQSLEEMNTWSILQQGPYSIDFTAGPDTNAFGDREGLDVPHNALVQNLIREYMRDGDEIGSHGGWIHNWFAGHVEKDNPAYLQQFLVLNRQALERVTGKPVLEYSAPNGDQPEWVTRWLDAHGFVAYYFTGDSGMGPTQVYRNGKRVTRHIWAFPILHLDRAASFEELTSEDYPASLVSQWLDQVVHFTADHRQVRLIYFHPPGIIPYHDVVHSWLQETAQLKASGRFRWYTMVQIANFLNSRKRVKWKLTQSNGEAVLKAVHPNSLAHFAWLFPAANYFRPRILSGSASVTQQPDGWLVIAGEGKRLEIEARILKP
jgi:hypothetical protein